MNFDDYQRDARLTASYPGIFRGDLIYPTLGLAGEAGEFTEKVKKLFRNKEVTQVSELSADDKAALVKELGDVLWYVSDLATTLGVPLSDVAGTNLRKLSDRAKRGVIKSEGDDR